MVENSFAKNIIELKLAASRIAEGKGAGAGVFTIKFQILYLIWSKGQATPQEIIYELNMAKSNLALITKKMIAEGLIVKKREAFNKKQIYYMVTDIGQKELSIKMNAINNLCFSENKELIKTLTKTVETLKNFK